MDRKEIFEKLTVIFRDVIDNQEIVLTEITCADDIDGWDSLAQIQLVSLIQKSFNIRFTAKEMLGWDNVGQMVDSIYNKV